MYVNHDNIEAVASKITCNSKFEDEVLSVVADLVELVNSANKFGCVMTAEVNNLWGHTVTVTAVPSVRQYSWSF